MVANNNAKLTKAQREKLWLSRNFVYSQALYRFNKMANTSRHRLLIAVKINLSNFQQNQATALQTLYFSAVELNFIAPQKSSCFTGQILVILVASTDCYPCVLRC